MGIHELEQGIKLIEKDREGFFKGPISSDLIVAAENFLNVIFPESYKKFLELKGCGNYKDKEFYGITDGDFQNGRIPNGIWLTGHKRKSSNIDKSLLLISQSIEGYYALDTAQMKNGECPVVDAIPVGKREDFKVIAPDFGAFFLGEINEALESAGGQ